MLPQQIFMPISGPVLPQSGSNVWGTALGALVSWEPFDFGLRKAHIAEAEAGRRHAELGMARTRFELAAQTADAFLTALAADRTVAAATASVERAATIEQLVAALVSAELKPGADLSRGRAELAQARAQLVQAQQGARAARILLKQLTGDLPASLSAGPLLQLPSQVVLPEAIEHPAIAEQNGAIEVARSQSASLDRAYFPKFHLQAVGFGRGSGVQPDGRTGGAASGLGPNVGNWGLGMSVTFPVMELAGLRARRESAAFRQRAENARLELVRRDIGARREQAQNALAASLEVAALTPAQTQAARDALDQASARYRAGLATLAEVAEAQRLLTQSEIDDSLAKLQVWRGRLAVAAAEGSLDGFLRSAQ
ncbi:MAG: TolC family protein [Hyphomonadaceae bacterium]|nr:TolC family protein [Hyphomonadaceae bacterium]